MHVEERIAEPDTEHHERRGGRLGVAALAVWAALAMLALLRNDLPASLIEPAPWLGHGLLFFWFSLAAFSLVAKSARGALITILALCGVAAVSELIQPLVTAQRRAEIGDFLANLAGIAGAGLVLLALRSGGTLRPTSRRFVSILCLAASLVVGGLLALGTEWAQLRWDCRDHAVGRGAVVLAADSNSASSVANDSVGLRCAALRHDGLTVNAVVTSDDLEQAGPARLLTSSNGTGPDQVNFHLGQEADALSVRVRVRENPSREWLLVPGVFTSSEPTLVSLEIAEGGALVVVTVNDVERAVFDFEDATLAGWDVDYPFLLGDELTHDRPFAGSIEVEILAGADPRREP